MTKGGRRLSYEDDFWYKELFPLPEKYKWKIRRFPLTFLFTELFPLPVTQKSIQCKSSKTKKNSWNNPWIKLFMNNHISVIFFDKKTMKTWILRLKQAKKWKKDYSKMTYCTRMNWKSVQKLWMNINEKTTESCAKFLCFSCVKYNPTFVIFVNNSMHTHGNTHSESIRML